MILQMVAFTEGKPWFPVNPNYRDINVAHQLEDESILYLIFTKIDSIKRNLMKFIRTDSLI